MAEGFFRKAIQGHSEIECLGSAGVAAYDGDRMSPETATLLANNQIELADFSSRMVTTELLESATHIYAMTRSHLAMLVGTFPAVQSKCYLVCDHLEEDQGKGMDVPDPIGMGNAAYLQVGEVFTHAIPTIIESLENHS